MTKIKTPVTVQLAGVASANIVDANNRIIAICRSNLIGGTYYPPGFYANQIADALNRTADLEAIRMAAEALVKEMDGLDFAEYHTSEDLRPYRQARAALKAALATGKEKE